MPQLPQCFPSLPPSPLQLRSFELYRSSVFIVLVKTDKSSNITFEYFDVRESENDIEQNINCEEVAETSGRKRCRGPNVRKKMGYIITTMQSTSPNCTTSISASSTDQLELDGSMSMAYPSFKGIFLAEEYRNQSLGDERGGGDGPSSSGGRHRSLSHAMMDVYYRFLVHLYKEYSRLLLSSSDDTSAAAGDNATTVDIASQETLPTMFFSSSCVMRKVLVCKLLTSHGWLPAASSQGFAVVVLPRAKSLPPPSFLSTDASSPSQRDADTTHVEKVRDEDKPCPMRCDDAKVTRICSRVLSIQAMQSKMFSPRTCQAQGIEILSWEDAAAFQSQSHSAQCQQMSADGNTRNVMMSGDGGKVGSEVTVNCAYAIELRALLALVSDGATVAEDKGVFSFEDTL